MTGRAGQSVEPGLFVTIEGGDGAGKSTQAALLEEWLVASGRTVVRTREPGGTDFGLEVREIVLHSRGHITPRAEALLYAADRAQHIATKVRPALDRGEVVIQDRYIDSSVAYQGAGRVLDGAEIRRLSEWATEDLVPDLTVLIDLDESLARERLNSAQKRFDRLEAEKNEFHRRVRESFLSIAKAEPERFVVVDGALSPAEISARIRHRLTPLLVSPAR
ncbi:dTMP kinase [Subtercola boreus]|uniref:Thymidylate kinase n=1 Tax=Subtercola boreus TaxID=120213 RepID=A0A3E0WD60_9MICO|nr:dTMP kinase [Subtercola boreus]RFA22568.1 dTMP kinase [Subtercola boreus]RFA22924.1 dTMP kinase [Subtercola boreus]RFA28676.1 dTMP kinase [Subtercola boreus]